MTIIRNTGLLAGTVLVSVLVSAFIVQSVRAYSPDSYYLDYLDTSSVEHDQGVVLNPTYPGTGQLFSTDPISGELKLINIEAGSGLHSSGTGLYLAGVPSDKVSWDGYPVYNVLNDINIATTTMKGQIISLQAQISLLQANSNPFNVGAFMANQGSTTPYVASTTFNGFMSGSMFSKLAAAGTSTVAVTGAYADLTGKPTIPSVSTSTPTVSTSNRTLNSCFQVSTVKDAFVSYSIDVDSTVSLSGGAVGQVALTTFTDSGCTTGTSTVSKGKTGLTGTLVVGLTLNNPSTLTLGGVIVRNLYAKLITTNVTGTPTFTMNTTQEVTGTLVQ